MKLGSAPGITARLVALVTVALLGACTCHAETAGNVVAKQQGGKPQPSTAQPSEDQPSKAAPSQPPAKDPAPTNAAPAGPLPGDEADPRGERFLDPPWFRKEMLGPDAKAMDVSRSSRNEQGLFSSQILFELPAGTTAEQCADALEAKVKGDVADLVRAADSTSPGRLKLTGATDRYRVTMMCGEAKGVMRAYVGYEWLN